MVGVLILSLLFLANLSAISLCRIESEKEKDHAIVLDFVTHYLEMVRGLPFAEVRAGEPINPLLDGGQGGPRIVIPATTEWISLNTTDYESFHPEIVWLSAKHPEMRVQLVVQQAGGEDHTKWLIMELRWDAPLGRGGKLNARFDLTRYRDT